MKVILYSTGCPKCKVLEQKLNLADISYEVFNDTEKMIEMGMTTMPILEVDSIKMDFKKAIDFVNERIIK